MHRWQFTGVSFPYLVTFWLKDDYNPKRQGWGQHPQMYHHAHVTSHVCCTVFGLCRETKARSKPTQDGGACRLHTERSLAASRFKPNPFDNFYTKVSISSVSILIKIVKNTHRNFPKCKLSHNLEAKTKRYSIYYHGKQRKAANIEAGTSTICHFSLEK